MADLTSELTAPAVEAPDAAPAAVEATPAAESAGVVISARAQVNTLTKPTDTAALKNAWRAWNQMNVDYDPHWVSEIDRRLAAAEKTREEVIGLNDGQIGALKEAFALDQAKEAWEKAKADTTSTEWIERMDRWLKEAGKSRADIGVDTEEADLLFKWLELHHAFAALQMAQKADSAERDPGRLIAAMDKHLAAAGEVRETLGTTDQNINEMHLRGARTAWQMAQAEDDAGKDSGAMLDSMDRHLRATIGATEAQVDAMRAKSKKTGLK